MPFQIVTLHVSGASLKMNENPTQIGLYYAHLIYTKPIIHELSTTVCLIVEILPVNL
jgi:hypothetical protein